jgi:hypothetical protein
MSRFAEINASRVANGYGVEIPCGQVIAPHLDYFVTAHDEAGTVIASAGSEDQPFRVSVVRTRTRPAPALPGRMPPEACGEDCPPGMSGPQCRRGGGGGRGARQLGDPCDAAEQCAEGLTCREGSCAQDTGGGGGAPASWYRFGFDIGGGFAAGLLSPSSLEVGEEFHNGDPVERSRYQRGVFYAEGMYDVVCARDFSVCAVRGTPEATAIEAGAFFRLLGDSVVSFTDASGNASQRPGGATCIEGYNCPRLSGTGLTPGGFIHVTARVNILKQLGVGVFARINPDFASVTRYMSPVGVVPSNAGILPMMVLGARLYYAVTPNGFAREGLNVAPFIGGGFGQIQFRPFGTANAAHVRSGTLNLQAGARVEYGFMRMFHVGGDVALNFQLPVTARALETFIFGFDLAANVGMHF